MGERLIGTGCYRSPWGKADRSTGTFHHLAHHCADVAACLEAILALPVVRARIERTAGRSLSDTAVARLVVLAFLHDIGKLHPGFQAKAWPPNSWMGILHGHLAEGAAIFTRHAPEAIACNLRIDEVIRWDPGALVLASLAHHGRPFRFENAPASKSWARVASMRYDPLAASAEIGAVLPRWFSRAFDCNSESLPQGADFQHFFCGLVSLADWLGSNRDVFDFVETLDPNYIETARENARAAVAGVGLDVTARRIRVADRVDFAALTGFDTPRPQQHLVGESPLDEQLLILEAETGSGKTEAALWRFAQLFEAGRVDSLYFALPTRAAAIQLHGRVNEALKNLFGDLAPEVVLAVPGYLKAGEVLGRALPDWKVRWDDDGDADEEKLLSRWAAESARRYLAAMVAVGTVDQAMLAALQVKHAHLRAAALSRSLLVIDEVHASDRYMSEIQSHLLRSHLGRGGYALLMSATLGSVARSRWLGRTLPSFTAAVTTSYPAVWCTADEHPRRTNREANQKRVTVLPIPTMKADSAAQLAVEAAQAGARVLVVRNTVGAAIDVFQAVIEAGAAHLLLSVAGGPALHHSRFAAEDRTLLDASVEIALSPRERESGGVIVIGTQTLEQSLDIDADVLVTDLCPIDVLLQRIGRLHRHGFARPVGFEHARCFVMVPDKGLARLLAPAFENGLGVLRNGGGIYSDLSVLELTRRLIEAHPNWSIPAMNRMLVESATHPDRIASLHTELGPAWSNYHNNVYGRLVAEAGAARLGVLPVGLPFDELKFASDEEKIRTRLGAEGARVVFSSPVPGPFGQEVTSITLPAHWSQDFDTREVISPVVEDGNLKFTTGKWNLIYTRAGLTKT